MNNKKGVKLLAAVLAFAMVFVAGFAIIGNADEADAAAADLDEVAGLELAQAGTEYTAAKKLLVKSDMEIKLNGTTDGDVTVYLVSGKNLTVTGTTANLLDVIVYVASSAADIVSATVSGTYEGTINITINDLKATSVKFTDNYAATSTNSTITLSGDATGAASVAGTSGKTLIGTTGLKTSVAATNMTCGIETKIGSTYTYYPTAGNANTVNLTASGDYVKVYNGSAIVSQDSNVVELKEVCSTGSITVGYGTTYPSIGGTIASATNNEDNIVTVKSGIVLDQGYVSGSSPAFVFTNGNPNFVSTTANSKIFYTSQVIDKVGTNDVTAATVNGYVIQKASVDLKNTAAGATITVASKAQYVITENAVVKCNVLDIDAGSSAADLKTIRIMGQLYTYAAIDAAGASASPYANIKIGPVGYYSDNGGSTTAKANGNTNVYSGDDFEIKGIPSTPSVGDAILTGDLTIPEKTTFTVTGNLGLNGHKITVNGTLVIAKNASIYGINPTNYTNENITIASTGKIQNEGNIGAMLPVCVSSTNGNVTIQGVNGVEFGFKTIGDYTRLAISGDLKANRNAIKSIVTFDGAANGSVISGDLIIGKDVTVTQVASAAEETDVVKGSTITVNGTLSGVSTKGYNLGENTEIIVNGILATDVPLNVLYGEYNTRTGKLPTTATYVTVKNDVFFVKGYTVYNAKVGVTGTNDITTYYLRVFMSGVADVAVPEGESNTTGTLDISGDLYIAADDSLTVKKSVTVTASKLIVDGNIVFMDGSTNTVTAYKGAYYVVTVQGTSPATTKYYTTIDNALANIETADDKMITVYIDSLYKSFDIEAGQTVSLTLGATGEIASDAVVTVKDDGTLAGTITKVEGMLIVMPDATSVTPGSYASKKVSADGTTTYAGFAVAVSSAVAGDVIDIDSAIVGGPQNWKNLSIPADVKVVIADTLTVYGNVTVPEGAELVGGAIVVNGTTSKTAEVKVAGTLDISSGSISGNNNVVSSTGSVIQGTTFSGMNVNGAYYQNADGDYVLTSVAKAVAASKSIKVAGIVSESADLDLTGKTVTLDTGAKVVLGKVALAPTAKINATAGELTATVSALDGKADTTGATATGVLKVVKSSTVIESKKTTSAAGVDTYAFTISTIDGEMTLAEGTMTVNANLTAVAGSKFSVASGAAMNIIGGSTAITVTIDGDNVEFVNNGTVNVIEATLNFEDIANTGKTPVIAGTLNIGKNATVNAESLSILGTVVVSNTEDAVGEFDVKASAVTVGTAIKTIGADASIVGPVKIDNATSLKAYAGADLSKAVINVPTGGETTIKTTEFYVNDVLYATVYAEGTVTVASVISGAELSKIEGVTAITTPAWKNADGTTSTATNIGDAEALYVTMTLSKADITVSVGTGISLWIDGVKYNSGSTAQLTIGEHQVKATINPGYKGTVTVTFDGKTVTNEKIAVTAAMLGATNVISATGDITIDAGETPAPTPEPEKDDSGMGITDYLLIVLVILAAILVVIVAIRMMRS